MKKMKIKSKKSRIGRPSTVVKKRKNPYQALEFYLNGVRLENYRTYRTLNDIEKVFFISALWKKIDNFHILSEFSNGFKFEIEVNNKIIPFAILYYTTQYNENFKYIVGIVEEHPSIEGHIKIEYHDYINVIHEKIIPITKKNEYIENLIDHLKRHFILRIEEDLDILRNKIKGTDVVAKIDNLIIEADKKLKLKIGTKSAQISSSPHPTSGVVIRRKK